MPALAKRGSKKASKPVPIEKIDKAANISLDRVVMLLISMRRNVAAIHRSMSAVVAGGKKFKQPDAARVRVRPGDIEFMEGMLSDSYPRPLKEQLIALSEDTNLDQLLTAGKCLTTIKEKSKK